MTDADIYRKAAELIDGGSFKFVADALIDVCDYSTAKDLIFRYKENNHLYFRMDDGDREQRVLALLLMAAISDE